MELRHFLLNHKHGKRFIKYMRLTLGDEPVSNEFPNLSNIMLRSAGSRKPCTRKEIFGLWSYPKRKLGDKGKCHLYKTTSFTLKMMKSSSNEKIYLHVLSLLRPKGFNKENSKEDIIRVISSPLLSYWKHNLLCANQGRQLSSYDPFVISCLWVSR